MGGKESIRGYTYQTIISVIQSLTDKSWDFLQIEPNGESSKADIIWISSKGEENIQQVKSSINNFQKSEIIVWLEELAKLKKFSSYQLILIGSSSQETRSFVNRINSKKEISESQIINENIEKIRVELYPFRQDLLESKISLEVLKYLESIRVNIKPSAGNLIMGGLIYQFFQFSIIGEKVSRIEFNNYFKSWVETNYSKEVIKERVSEFRIKYYNHAGHTLDSGYKGKKLLFNTGDIISKQTSLIEDAYRNAASISLPARTIQIEEEKNVFGLTASSLSLTKPTPAEISEEMRNTIVDCLRKYFAIEVESDFFNIGDLMREPINVMTFYFPSKDFKGSEIEIEKNQKIRSLYWEILTLNELVTFVNNLNQYYTLPFVITNTGENYDEDITVDLMFPKEVKVLDFENFYTPDDYDALSLFIKSELVKKNLQLNANSMVNKYDEIYEQDYKPFENLDLMYQLGNTSKRLDNRKKHFLRQIDHLFEHEVFHDAKEYTMLRYTFKKVNPNVNVFFPSLILIKASTNFDISYSIKSKHSGNIYQGVLTFEAPEN